MTGPTKLQRWLDLIAFLAGRHFPVAVEELWRNLPAYAHGVDADKKTHEAVRRMFERDKDELRALGIPIEAVEYTMHYGREQAVGYRLARKDFHLPYLRLVREAEAGRGEAPEGPPARVEELQLTETEAAAALGGLREVSSVPGFPLAGEARSAFRKLAFDLDVGLLRDDPVVHLEDPEAEASSDALRRLTGALRTRKSVRFRYHSMARDATEERSAHPYGLFFQHGRWYLVAFDEAREEPRMFRLGRMSDVAANAAAPGTPDYQVPQDFELARYTGRSAWELGEDAEGTVDSRVRFAFPRSLWAERNGHGRLVRPLEDGSQVRGFEVHRRDPFLRWLLSLAGDAVVEEPPELREQFRNLARGVAALHGAPLGVDPGEGGSP